MILIASSCLNWGTLKTLSLLQPCLPWIIQNHSAGNAVTWQVSAGEDLASYVVTRLSFSHTIPLSIYPIFGLAGEIWATGEYSYKTDVYSWSHIYWEMCYERKPYRGMSAMEHQEFVCKGGKRPPLECYCLPDQLNAILMQAWEHDPTRRLDMDKVCAKMQRLLVELDTCIVYEENEEDFLFDIHVPVALDDAVSVVSDDEGQFALSTDELDVIDSVAGTSITPVEVVVQNSDINWMIPADGLLPAVSYPDLSQCGGDACCTPSPPWAVVVIEAEVAPARPLSPTITAKIHSRTPSVSSTFSSTPVKMGPSAA
jgi:Protein tyrosine and serine/threonine kinase